VVRVFVSDQNAGEIFRRATDGGEALADLTGAEPGIDQDAGFVGFHVGAIARRSAAKNCEANSHGFELNHASENRQWFFAKM